MDASRSNQTRLLRVASWAFLVGCLLFVMAILTFRLVLLVGAAPQLMFYLCSALLLGSLTAFGVFAAISPHLRCAACQASLIGGVQPAARPGFHWTRVVYSTLRRRSSVCPRCGSNWRPGEESNPQPPA